ncbi:MAG TPA: hypothetical protein V6C99_12220 [Oculatellaceae cyanobacterium]|jgi:acetolactate synthase small subunit
MNQFATLECRLQSRLGGLDRVLGALTHRGFLPERMETFRDKSNGTICVRVEFACDDAKTVEKLVKFLEKQVYVLEVCAALPVSLNELSVA